MKLIVGLGNVGSRYANTRHNVGFMVVDELARRHHATWKHDLKLRAEVASFELEGEKIILAKPATMMNLSGGAVQRLMQHHRAPTTALWLVYDDVDTPFGRLRMRYGGSSGGHQGVRSTIENIGEDFERVRVGISLNDRAVEPSEVYVLRPFDETEQVDLPAVLTGAAEAIEDALINDADDATIDLI